MVVVPQLGATIGQCHVYGIKCVRVYGGDTFGPWSLFSVYALLRPNTIRLCMLSHQFKVAWDGCTHDLPHIGNSAHAIVFGEPHT